ncbi:MAG: aminotransferase class V-fold PLP-dependent enzyme, partial [Oscillospiraceae bacterium]|nr:aminotransferase class V-fold PLP-dependent enzyme [Oscillospiraceae bacterium]
MYSGTNVDKYSFRNDYSESAHPKIIEKLLSLAYETNTPYGEDKHSEAAANIIRDLCGKPDATVSFIGGGTATNVLAISAFLRNTYDAVICADTGHINVHETGSIEYAGRKAITIPVGVDGKLTPELIDPVFKGFESEHMVVPKLVYISQSTELGTIYSKAEISALSEYCHANGMKLFVDGARLASALMSRYNDVTLKDLGALCDGFYLGGTKNGLLFGEALVLTDAESADHLRWLIKQRGFMLA